ncbi:uncharacterized protein LOC132557677 [Ylistrum balloti]|uniref:uncharacterized protein LOC132557677 n=1 Tax=Ylistrum balloti TaxID=509963 RepID=UPI002905B22F|nr:uncharacterized protein LOC132557677 [Ylistrum balloti]
MAKCSSRQIAFVIFNFIFLCLGLGLVGFVTWTLATIPNANEFISGTHVVTLTSFCLGFVILVIGGIGCAAGFCKGLCILKTYVGFMITLLFLELGLVFFIYSEKSQIPSVMIDSWDGLNTDTRYRIQTELKCCGIQNYTEYGTDVESYPSSCFVVYDVTGIIERTVDNLFTMNCLTQMQNWLNTHVPIWASVILGIAVIEFLGGLTSCIFLQRVQKKIKVKPDEESKSADMEMAAMEEGSSKDQGSIDTENEEHDNKMNSSNLLIVTSASQRDIKDNSNIDYLNQDIGDTSSTKTDNDVTDGDNIETISHRSIEGSSLLLVASVTNKETHVKEERKDCDDEVETIILTQTGPSDVTDDCQNKKEDIVSNHNGPDQSMILIGSVVKEDTATTETPATSVQDDCDVITLDQTTTEDVREDSDDKRDDNVSNHSSPNQTVVLAGSVTTEGTTATLDQTTNEDVKEDSDDNRDDNVSNHSSPNQTVVLAGSVITEDTTAITQATMSVQDDCDVITLDQTTTGDVKKDSDDNRDDNVSNHCSLNQTVILAGSVTTEDTTAITQATMSVQDDCDVITLDQTTTEEVKAGSNDNEDDDNISNHSTAGQLNKDTYAGRELNAGSETEEVDTITLTTKTSSS